MSDIADKETTITVQINFFGAFRKFGDALSLIIAPGSTADEIKQQLIAELGENQRALVEDSVLASDTQVLTDSHTIDEACELSILPPVCGG